MLATPARRRHLGTAYPGPQEPQETYRVQTSALPDLAHTDAKPVHWLATATAMAAVVALAGLLQPDAATATASASEHGGVTTQHGSASSATAPDPKGVAFPSTAAPRDTPWPTAPRETSTATAVPRRSPSCTAPRDRAPRPAASTS